MPILASGVAYFSADNGTNGRELWKSDGSAPNTVLVKDINPGSNPSFDGGYPGPGFTSIGATLYFVADDGTHGRELWKTDGTTPNTVLVKDIRPGPDESEMGVFENLNGMLFFNADDGTHGDELWQSDGSEIGTTVFIDLNSTGSDEKNSSGQPPRKNTTAIADLNGTLIFTAGDAIDGIELWKSDGTLPGTVLLKDINPGPASAFRGEYDKMEFTALGNTLIFIADDGTHGHELWKTDGTGPGTVLVKDINPGTASTPASGFTALNGILCFSAFEISTGYELWKTDGTGPGTVLVKDIYSGSNSSFPGEMVEFAGSIFFNARDNFHGRELWKTDGTGPGTVLVKDIDSGSGSGSPSNLTKFNGSLFFNADDGIHGHELWKTDGTAVGTVLFKDNYSGSSSSHPGNLIDANGTLFFYAGDGIHGGELWKSDGTAAGTILVKDIYPGPTRSTPHRVDPAFTNVNGTLFFVAEDGVHGTAIWRSDGTAGGTIMVKDILPGPGYVNYDGSTIEELVNINGTLFFRADDGVSGPELWSSNGSAATTNLAEDLGPGAVGSLPEGFLEMNGKIYYFGSTGPGGAWTLRYFDVPFVPVAELPKLPRPENRIGKKANKQAGNNIYNTSGAGQQARVKSFGRKKAKFFFSVQNDGRGADTIRVTATRKNKKFKPKYIQLAPVRANVTAALSTGSLLLEDLAEGDLAIFKAIVKPQRRIIEKQKKQKFFITSKSTTDDTTVDRALAKVKKKKPK